MLDYIALLKGITPRVSRICATNEALAVTNLRFAAKRKIRTYSRGMKQRLGIAQTLISKTPVLILDEPTANLDPDERNKFRRLITDLSQNQLVLFSSSILTDIVCADAAVIFHKGCCRFSGTPADLAALAKPAVLTPLDEHTSTTVSLQRGYRAVLSQVNNP
jgi:ABC-type multidrug transport system ATPase subunit